MTHHGKSAHANETDQFDCTQFQSISHRLDLFYFKMQNKTIFSSIIMFLYTLQCLTCIVWDECALHLCKNVFPMKKLHSKRSPAIIVEHYQFHCTIRVPNQVNLKSQAKPFQRKTNKSEINSIFSAIIITNNQPIIYFLLFSQSY